MENIFKQLGIKPEEYFLTGSRALDTEDFKVSSEQSDYDYVLLVTNRHTLLQYVNDTKLKIEFSCYNGGFKVYLDDKIYNIITPIFIEFMAWREALNIIQNLIKIDDRYKQAIKTKMGRYCLYEQLRGLIKSTLFIGELQK